MPDTLRSSIICTIQRFLHSVVVQGLVGSAKRSSSTAIYLRSKSCNGKRHLLPEDSRCLPHLRNQTTQDRPFRRRSDHQPCSDQTRCLVTGLPRLGQRCRCSTHREVQRPRFPSRSHSRTRRLIEPTPHHRDDSASPYSIRWVLQ